MYNYIYNERVHVVAFGVSSNNDGELRIKLGLD